MTLGPPMWISPGSPGAASDPSGPTTRLSVKKWGRPAEPSLVRNCSRFAIAAARPRCSPSAATSSDSADTRSTTWRSTLAPSSSRTFTGEVDSEVCPAPVTKRRMKMPIWRRSPSCSGVGLVMRWPLTRVPLALPRSTAM